MRISDWSSDVCSSDLQTDYAEAQRMVDSAREHGINFIDTADVYTNGGSEEMVGKLIGANRHDWVLASKLGNSMGKAPNQSHYSRHWMTHEDNQSLRRLNTEHLDILYLRSEERSVGKEGVSSIDF